MIFPLFGLTIPSFSNTKSRRISSLESEIDALSEERRVVLAGINLTKQQLQAGRARVHAIDAEASALQTQLSAAKAAKSASVPDGIDLSKPVDGEV